MSASEFFFLALGLLLGMAVGAALLDVIRSRPPAPEVRLTVTHNALPPKLGPTLTPVGAAIASGGLTVPAASVSTAAAHRALRAAGVVRAAALRANGPESERVGLPVARGVDPALAALRPADGAEQRRTGAPGRGLATVRDEAPQALAVVGRVGGVALASAAEPRGSGSTPTARDLDEAAGPCATERVVADERCAVAARAREAAEVAANEVRAAQRAYDESTRREEEAARAGDPRALRAAKDAAQHAFHEARRTATSPAELEQAAAAWLAEIDRLNRLARDSGTILARERQQAAELVARVEQLSLRADAARISAEMAAEACQQARQALADCEEQRVGMPAGVNWGSGAAGPVSPGARLLDDDVPGGSLADGPQPAILRVLRGDRTALVRIVDEITGGVPEERRRYQLLLTDLIDAIVARAIEESYLDFPMEHPFWETFSHAQARDIAAALASLGYHFDGLGGWAAGRQPSQRDLSLAVGYAGLEPVRIRHWPTESQMSELYREVRVAADEYLSASAAADLSMGEMITLLGRRAEGLAELWNAWGRVRPLLLATE
ncbi:MAG TPA: hypothetical protein VFK38_01545 [Candidatus Limnocylindrales bacterium]|nr:hypothetical protein [Candidatus Limnocylindrales bacterium]